MNSRSRSSTSAVISLALSASVRASTKVGVPQTSAARRAAIRLRSCAAGGLSTLPALWSPLFVGGGLRLEGTPAGPGFNIGLHDLERVQRPAETGFRVGHDRHEPVDLGAAFGVLDLVGTLEGAVDAAAQFGTGIGRIEALVGIHRARGVGVGGDLPARQIDRRKPG